MTAADPPPPSPAVAETPAVPPSRGRRQAAPPRARALLAAWSAQMLGVLAIGLPLALVAALAAVLHSPAGTAWLLGGVPGLRVERVQGALLGSDFAVERMVATWPGRGQLEVEGLSWNGARWRWWLSATLWAGVEMDRLTVRRLRWRSAPGAPPLRPPQDARLPVQWRVPQLTIESLDVDGVRVDELSARLELGSDEGRVHQLQGMRARTGRMSVTGDIRLNAGTTPAVNGSFGMQSLEGPRWQAQLEAQGPLEAIRVQAQLQGESPKPVQPDRTSRQGRRPEARASAAGALAAGAEVPSLQGEFMLHPFDPWPLGAMSLRVQSLDLSALAIAWPRTSLSGRADIRTAGLDRPAHAEIQLENALPETWDRGGLPLRRVALALRATPGQTHTLEFQDAVIELGQGRQPAGQLQGRGRWDATGLDLDLSLTELRPQWLHSGAAAMSLSGPLKARIAGLPPLSSVGMRPTANRAGVPRPPLTVEVEANLQGEAPTLKEPVRVALEGSATEGRWEWRRLEATAGPARAQSTGVAERDARGAWRTRNQGRLERFDLARWWPGDPDGAWRGGRHDLNADWSLDLTLPQRTARMSTLQWIQSLQGVGELKVGESAWAGVPLTGRLQFGQGGARARPDRSSVEGELRIGGNRLQVQGQADIGGSGEDDRWELSLDAPAVRDIAPLTALHPSLAAWSPRGGRLKATLSARGRWPRLVSHGAVEAEGLTAGVLSLERGRVTWRADSIDRQTGELQLELAQAQWSHTRLDRLQARLDGTFARHRAQLSWQAPTPLPPRMVQVLGGVEADRSRGELSVEGSWSAEADGSGQWRGQLHQVSAVAMPAGNVTAPPPWLEARDIPARADFSPGGRLSELRIGAGRVRLGPSLRLRWDDISYRLTGERRDVDLDFEIEPTEVNPLLQRANTGLNWAGDLRMSLRGRIRAAQDVRADIELRRLGGDLLVGDEGDRKALGLTQAGLTLSVERGVWRVAPLLAGTQLGTISGNLELRTSPEARWPDNEAALSGAVQAQVIDLSIWSAWVPPGWGLSGRVATTASLAGRLGAPELVGELQASEIGVRNLLQGVSFRDGRARIALRGDRAQIEQLELRGGDGSLRVSGDADIGAQPRARLRLDARQLTVLGRINRQLTVSGEGAVDLRADRLDLRGRFAVDRGLIDLGTPEIPTLDADVVVGPSAAAPSADPPVGPAATPSVAPPIAPGPWIRGSTAALDIDLGRQLRVRGRGVDTPLQGQLKVGVQDGRLAVNGTVDARGGTYAAYGQKLEIDRGRVLFAGSPDNPRLDLLALRPQTDMRVGVAIVGTAQNPRVRLYSDPEMSERDKLSWLVLGRGAEGLGRTDTTMLQRAAVALLSGEQEAPTDALLKALGIDELTFSQTDGDVRDTVVGLGKQLGRNWYLGYERGVNATAGTWQLVYRLARQFTLRARSGEDASMDLVWTWRFDRPREIGAAMRGRPPAETQESTDTGSAAPTGPFPGSGSPRPDKR